MGEDAAEFVNLACVVEEAVFACLVANPFGALGAGGVKDASDDFGAQAGLEVGAGDGAGDAGAGQAGDEVFTDVGGDAVEGFDRLRGRACARCL